jgi:hypothetical protein
MKIITLQISGQQIHIDHNLNAAVVLRPDGLHIRTVRSAEPPATSKTAPAVKVRTGRPSRIKVHLDRVKAGMCPIEICRSSVITPQTLFQIVSGKGYYFGRGGNYKLWMHYFTQHWDAWSQLLAAGWRSIPDDIV